MPDPCSSRLTIEIANRQDLLSVDAQRLSQAVAKILTDADIIEAEISIAIVDDAEIHEINNRFLGHDYPTDVISFPLESEPGRLTGEIVASAETAITAAAEINSTAGAEWDAGSELLLYVIHGALHLVGHDDHDPARTVQMRAAERQYLQAVGVNPPAEQESTDNNSSAVDSTASASSTQQEQ